MSTQPAEGMRRTILVVDDTPLIRELGALFLARAGRVLTAASGEEALALVRTVRPDLVVADLRMPGLDGAELCRRIKRDPLTMCLPVVLLTATGEAEERERAVHAGADDVLPKPIERLALLETARRYLWHARPRGLPRIALEAPVRLRRQRLEWGGTARNLSRGGIFVETVCLLETRAELDLALQLPESRDVVASTAQVIWTRERVRDLRAGMGLRFLGLDRSAARTLTEYVDERLPALALAPREIET